MGATKNETRMHADARGCGLCLRRLVPFLDARAVALTGGVAIRLQAQASGDYCLSSIFEEPARTDCLQLELWWLHTIHNPKGDPAGGRNGQIFVSSTSLTGHRTMRVHDLKDEQGRVLAFQVPNVLIGRRGACALAKRVPGARLLREPLPWSYFREEEFCEFEVRGRRFVILEPFGDNSRYWIGPNEPGWSEQIADIRRVFAEANALAAGLRGLLARVRQLLPMPS